MKITLDPALLEDLKMITCCYTNETNQLQIVRVANVSCGYFERTILPGQQLDFQTSAEAFLEIHTYELCSSVLTDRIACERLIVQNYPYPACALSQKQPFAASPC